MAAKNKKEGKKKNNGDDPEDGDPRADTKEHQSKLWTNIKNWVVMILVTTLKCLMNCLQRIVFQSGREHLELQSGREHLELQSDGHRVTLESSGGRFRVPINSARFPVLDEDMMAEGGHRSLPPDYGGGRRLTDRQSEKKDVGQTRFESRGIAISTTPIQTDSNLMQPKVEATSKRVSNNDTHTSRHLSTDHLNQEIKIGCMSMFGPKKDRKKTSNHAK